MKKCLVRFDDVCPTMDMEQFNRAVELMDKYNIQPLIGIIPANEDPEQILAKEDLEFWNKILHFQSKGWTVALHGYTHVYDQENPKTIVCGRKHSEFAGNTYKNQFEKIRKGKEILNCNGINTNVFFAPAHTYDKNTLRALKDNGFKYINDGMAAKPYVQEGIVCIPVRSFGIPDNEKNNINVAVNHSSEWRRENKANDYYRLEEFCERNKGSFVSFEELKDGKTGVFVVQKTIEKIYILKRNIKECIKRFVRR